MKNYYKGVAIFSLGPANGGFYHNLERDLHLFVIWEKGRGNEHAILEELSSVFDVLAVCDIQWSSELLDLNFRRFYKANYTGPGQSKAAEVGGGAFVAIVVEDRSPSYRYRQNVSGKVELVNVNVLSLKRAARKICGGYFIHSSGSPDEFYEQAVLLFGEQRLLNIINGDLREYRLEIHEDLTGSRGWQSFSELFATLRYCTKYVVLRNFEFLPNDFFTNDKDVDILCSDAYELLNAANATLLVPPKKGVAKIRVCVSDNSVPFDVRFPGDGYFDSRWQRDLLERRTVNDGGVFRPRDDDYFFSLLYHSVLQKPAVKPVYEDRLQELAKKLDFDFFSLNTIRNSRESASILEGFLKANKYAYVEPRDAGVYQHDRTLRHMEVSVGGTNKRRLLRTVRYVVPASWRRFVPAPLKRLVLNHL